MIRMTIPQISLLLLVEAQKSQTQSTLTGAVVTAANAIASALKPPETLSQQTTPNSNEQVSSAGISPCAHASLRRTIYQDLGTIQKLHEDCVLNTTEFNEQKQMLLNELRATMPSQPGPS